MDPELAKLERARAELDAQIVKLKTNKRVEAIKQIKTLMAENAVAVGDLTERPLYRSALPPAFADDQGNIWSGVGRRPLWLVDALLGGKKLEEFKVKK